MMKSKLCSRLLVLSICVIYNTSQSQNGTKYTNNQLVVSFSNVCNIDLSINYTKKTTMGKYAALKFFYDNEEEEIEYKRNTIQPKTIIVTKGNYVVMRHYLNFMDFNDYVFKKGDSILVEYKQNLPIISIVNRKTSKNDFNSEDMFRKNLRLNGYAPVSKYFESMSLFAQKLFNDKKMMNDAKSLTKEQIQQRNAEAETTIKKGLYAQCRSYLNEYHLFLDSLKNKALISEIPYHFYIDKIENLRTLLEVENDKLQQEQIQIILSKYTDNPYQYPDIYHNDLLRAVANKYIISKSKYLSMQDGRNKDPRDVYTQLKNSSLFTAKNKCFLMSREINRIAQLLPKKDFQNYFKLFEQDIQDTTLVNVTRERFFLQLEEDDQDTKTSLSLMTSQKKKVSLDEVLKNHVGKTVYVDFWASWCAPCRAEMPSSIKLRKDMANPNVVFVYISIDKNADSWQKAILKEGLSENNYLAANANSSDFMKQHKVDAIPRYMIIGKDGKVINTDAPRPSDPKIRKIFDDLLKQ